MLRTGQLLHPASLPGTLASPRTGLAPAGHRELVVRFRQVMASPPCPGVRTPGRTAAKTVVGARGFEPRTSSVSRNARHAIYLRKRSLTCGNALVIVRCLLVVAICFVGFPRDGMARPSPGIDAVCSLGVAPQWRKALRSNGAPTQSQRDLRSPCRGLGRDGGRSSRRRRRLQVLLVRSLRFGSHTTLLPVTGAGCIRSPRSSATSGRNGRAERPASSGPQVPPAPT
jgi:hypothetical protein